MPLSENQKRHLKALAHHRKVIVIVGAAGITDAVLAEIDAALAHHELVKVRVIAQRSGAELVQSIGHIATFFRRADKPVIALPR